MQACLHSCHIPGPLGSPPCPLHPSSCCMKLYCLPDCNSPVEPTQAGCRLHWLALHLLLQLLHCNQSGRTQKLWSRRESQGARLPPTALLLLFSCCRRLSTASLSPLLGLMVQPDLQHPPAHTGGVGQGRAGSAKQETHPRHGTTSTQQAGRVANMCVIVATDVAHAASCAVPPGNTSRGGADQL